MTSSKPEERECDHSGCKCRSGAGSVRRDDKVYCSERCADDYGCDHHGCNCGKFPTEQAVLGS